MSLSRPRYLFIDLYRTAVILLMLEGHVFRTFLQRDVQQSDLFQLHEFFHGLSAPAFLFGAGMTFVISTRRRWTEYHRWGQPLAKRVGRFLLIIALGLSMHLPFFSLRKIIHEGTTADFFQLFECDVLICIGIGLLLLQGLVLFFRTEGRFYIAVSAMTVAVCFLTPFVWSVDFLGVLPLPLAQLLSGAHGSPFPVFPFAGFLFAGAIVSWEFLAATERSEEQLFTLRMALAGAGLIALGTTLDALPVHLYPGYDFWLTSPEYFMVRVGALLLITCGFWRISRRFAQKEGILTVLGRESLFVYVAHLLILYGSAFNPQFNLRVLLGSDLSFGAAFGVYCILTGVLLAAAALWNYLRRNYLPVYRSIQFAASGLLLYLFFTRDF